MYKVYKDNIVSQDIYSFFFAKRMINFFGTRRSSNSMECIFKDVDYEKLIGLFYFLYLSKYNVEFHIYIILIFNGLELIILTTNRYYTLHCERRVNQLQQLNEMPLYPTEQVIWDENIVPYEHYSGEGGTF
uniref:Aquarius_N domain-containing protein n=1 Tax=Heterorhabditis bacteriophora TaxID=37862 RepID=A0A1I7W935_HETBA